jgi:putative two-component system response regulator
MGEPLAKMQLLPLPAMKRDPMPLPSSADDVGLAEAVAGLEASLGKRPAPSLEAVQRSFSDLQERIAQAPGWTSAGALTAAMNAGVFFHSACLPARTIAAAQLAAQLARRLDDLSELRKSLVLEAMGRGELGEYAVALDRLNEALEIALVQRQTAGQCSVWNQIGLALHQQGQAHEAAQAFEKALDLADQDAALLPHRTVVLTNLGLLGLDVPEFSRRGLGAAVTALALAPPPSSQMDRLNLVSLEAIAARLLAKEGDLDGARRRSNAAVEHAQEAGDRAIALAQIAKGVVEVAAGEFTEGIEKLRAAVDLARHKVKALHFPALRALIGAYETAGQAEVAKVYLEELLRLSREQKEQQLLLQQSKHIATVVKTTAGLPDLMDADIQRQRERLESGEISRDSVRSMMLLLEEHANAAELHDDSTSKHIYRVGRMSALIAKEIGLDENTQFMLDLSARLHDTGKLFVPDAILLKPGKLTDSERSIMQTHTTSGAEYLRKTGLPMIEVAAEIALCHHERFDGKGYPAGLKGSAIPISARIAALADVFDALTHERPYKSAWSIPEALAEIRSLRGTHFDPDLTDVFLLLVPRLQRETGDLDSFLAAEAENSRFVQTRRALAAKLKGIDPAVSAFELRR